MELCGVRQFDFVIFAYWVGFDIWCFYLACLAGLAWQKKLSAQEIQELVKGERNVPLIIDFYATWCGPCILMAQELEMVCFNLIGR